MQDTGSTSTTIHRFLTEPVVRNRVCPVVCRANVPHSWTVSVRVCSDDDTGDGHDMYTEVDEWDLRDFHRETTLVQNRRNVTLGSLHDQPKTRTRKDGFLLHVRLGLVGWISYWYFGDSALVVIILVALIKTLARSHGARQ